MRQQDLEDDEAKKYGVSVAVLCTHKNVAILTPPSSVQLFLARDHYFRSLKRGDDDDSAAVNGYPRAYLKHLLLNHLAQQQQQ